MRTWHGVSTLLIAFSDGTESTTAVSVETDGASIRVSVDGDSIEIPRSEAAQLGDTLQDVSRSRETFFRTACEHRDDGTYLVERRNADSTGNSTVFASFDEAKRLFDRLPEQFGADALGRAGYTGSRRHMLVRHFVEHPAFPCALTSRNPLTAEKQA